VGLRVVIKESIEIYRENSSIENLKKEIKLIKSARYEISEENDDYVCLSQSVTIDASRDTGSIIYKIGFPHLQN
jgi:hypothetical protein